MPVRNDILRLDAEMRSWRHHFHANPETAFEENDTADFIAEKLHAWGIEVHRGLAGTGVVGTLRAGSSGRSIGLRAEMDALLIEEAGNVPHRSRKIGKMHACGHDGHMAMLLGAAHYLAATQDFDGAICFIFQPAEENVAGGRLMVEEGLFDLFPVDSVFGLHNMPGQAEGSIAISTAPMMASADFFEVLVRGKGAHGGWPHNGVDAILVAAEIASGFNHIAARAIDPLEPVVISVTQFHAGQTNNVLPESAMLSGTTRAFSAIVQDKIEARMKRLCLGVAAAHGAEVEFKYDRRYPVVLNSFEEAAFAAGAAARVVGEANVLLSEPPVMGAEDFAWMLERRKGSFAWIGNGSDMDGSCRLHGSSYDFNDDILGRGASYFVELAEGWLTRRK